MLNAINIFKTGNRVFAIGDLKFEKFDEEIENRFNDLESNKVVSVFYSKEKGKVLLLEKGLRSNFFGGKLNADRNGDLED